MHRSIIAPMRRKGSLDLSITAIVVIVIAFVFLGLVLTLTRTIFRGAEEQLPKAISLTELEAEPTSSRPITISEQVEINRLKSKNLNLGFYNRLGGTAANAIFRITNCLSADEVSIDDPDELPKVASSSQNVEASSAAAYPIIVREQGMDPGTYVCTIVVCNSENCEDPDIYERKQFFLKVTS